MHISNLLQYTLCLSLGAVCCHPLDSNNLLPLVFTNHLKPHSQWFGQAQLEMHHHRSSQSCFPCITLPHCSQNYNPSGHGRTSTASSRSQWARPDFNRELQIPVGTAGLQPSRSQWALPDFNRELQIPVGTAGLQPRLPDPSGHGRTSTASSRFQWARPGFNRELQIPVGTAGLQPVYMPD
eukprot:s753_g13.t1